MRLWPRRPKEVIIKVPISTYAADLKHAKIDGMMEAMETLNDEAAYWNQQQRTRMEPEWVGLRSALQSLITEAGK